MPLGDQTNVEEIVINGSTEVTGSHSDYTVFLNHTSFSSEALDLNGAAHIHSTGKDLRFFVDEELTSEIAYDLIHIALDNDPANSLILIAINSPTLTTADKSVWAAYGDATASAYARDDTYGQDNAYDEWWQAFYAFTGEYDGTGSEVIDQTVNQNHGTGGNGVGARVPTRVSFGLLFGQSFDDTSGDMIVVPNSASIQIINAITLVATVNRAAGDAANGTVFWKGVSAGTATISSYSIFLDAADKQLITMYGSAGNVYTSTTALTDGTTNVIGTTWNGAGTPADNLKQFLNGSVDTTHSLSISSMRNHTNDLSIGTMTPAGYSNPFEGSMTFMSIHDAERSEDWMDTYFNNVTDIGNFITAGTQQDINGDGADIPRAFII